MATPNAQAAARNREEVLRLVALIPAGKFTTYGSLARALPLTARHVASVMSRLTPEEAERIPWHRVLAANARISPNMPARLAAKQKRLLKAEGLRISATGYVLDDEAHFHVVIPRETSGSP